jgi:hypothetical protein
MAAQTNDFQQLIALINNQLAPRGARVIESLELRDEVTGDKREIDVAIEQTLNERTSIIALECRDHPSKTPDVKWIDQIPTKYRNLPNIDLVLAISNTGFTEGAHRQAESHGIQLMTIDEARLADWPTIAFDTRARVLSVWSFEVTGIDVRTIDNTALKGEVDLTAAAFFAPDGKRVGNALLLFDWLIAQQPYLGQQIAEKLGEGADEVPFGFRLEGYVLRFKGHRYPVEGIFFTVRWGIESTAVSLQPRSFSEANIAMGTGNMPTWKTQLVVTKKPGEESSVGLSVRRQDGTKFGSGTTIRLYGVPD